MIEEAIRSAQSLTFELSPSNLAELTFKEAVESLVEEMELKHDILIYFEDDKQDKPVGEQLRGFLYQSIRELIVNAMKHGSAHSVEIYLRRVSDRLEVEVSDDGCGFKENVPVIPSASGGFGLFNIRERLRHFGGTIDIASTAGDGTRIVINVLIS
jgi:signal transduction histidine kinase